MSSQPSTSAVCYAGLLPTGLLSQVLKNKGTLIALLTKKLKHGQCFKTLKICEIKIINLTLNKDYQVLIKDPYNSSDLDYSIVCAVMLRASEH